ncbi:alpha-ketoglutarate decarboxylase [Aureitalea sp. L0-47]|uniref:alpha-ketoglutarate decarboxylase n=1 Tax=Aureitalea sp. L0-47 TaxID=2816962 RepID=UPI002237F7F1|nr:alpha-ketoglutarate decarboxylase [Aureitalea sp. L0-47]
MRSFYKRLVLSCIFCVVLSNFTTYAQEVEAPSNFWRNVRFGGGIGLSFGNGFFSGTLAPSAIYQFDQRFALGVGLNGTYNSQKDTYTSTILGGSVISLYNVIPEIQLSAEFEELNVNRSYDASLGFEDENYWYPALFVGAGFRTNNVTIGVRYDLLYDEEQSIYANAWMPFFRVFF